MKRAFTLIELLAATALAALLLLAGFKVIGSVGRARASIARAESARSYAPELLDLMRWDLANARYMKAGDSELVMTGYNGLDPATLAPTHRPVTVRYRIGQAATRNWLVREQTDLDIATNRNRWSTLVCSGLEGFELQVMTPSSGKKVPMKTQPLQRSRRKLTAADVSGWDGPAVGLDKPIDQDDLPDRLWLVTRPDGSEGLKVSEAITIR